MTIQHKLNFTAVIYQRIMKSLSIIDSFKGYWEVIALKDSKHLNELRKVATIESTGSSTRIEGATLSNKEVEALLKSVKITKLTSREQQEVMGYYDALQVILDNYGDLQLSERYIHQLHGILLKHSGKDQSHKGKYKSLSNQVVANYPDGSQRTIFRTTEPAMTAKEMEELLKWTEERMHEQDMHPLMITAVFAYEFLSIHPYQDGNGRLSRLLTTLMMMRMGYGFVQYVSFELIIEERKDDYYRVLMAGQKNRYSGDERIDQWVLYFLNCLVSLIGKLEVKYETYSKLGKGFNDRQWKVLDHVKLNGQARISEIGSALDGVSRNTLKKDLSFLVNEGFLIRTGEKRGVMYHYTEPK